MPPCLLLHVPRTPHQPLPHLACDSPDRGGRGGVVRGAGDHRRLGHDGLPGHGSFLRPDAHGRRHHRPSRDRHPSLPPPHRAGGSAPGGGVGDAGRRHLGAPQDAVSRRPPQGDRDRPALGHRTGGLRPRHGIRRLALLAAVCPARAGRHGRHRSAPGPQRRPRRRDDIGGASLRPRSGAAAGGKRSARDRPGRPRFGRQRTAIGRFDPPHAPRLLVDAALRGHADHAPH